MYFDTSWYRYRGDGSVPSGHSYDSRGEAGRYLADAELVNAVNTALLVEQPLLVVGESGTGKTMLAWSVASELGLLPVLPFHTRSDHHARDVLFVIDNLKRFYDAQIASMHAASIENYITWQALGLAIRSETQRVVLIDEIDKAPRDFPNDLLDELDRMEFSVPDLNMTYRAKHRPIVIITSNSERQLPDPFLRRCVFHHVDFPSEHALQAILRERLGPLRLSDALVETATTRFLQLRDPELRLEKRPATGELLAWLKMLSRANVDVGALADAAPAELPFLGTLIKSQSDLTAIRSSAT